MNPSEETLLREDLAGSALKLLGRLILQVELGEVSPKIALYDAFIGGMNLAREIYKPLADKIENAA